MKFPRFLFALTALVAVLAFGACGSDDDSSSGSSGGGDGAALSADEPIDATALIIGYVPYVDTYVEKMKAAAKKAKVNLELLDGKFKSDVQAQQMQTVISEKPDAVIVFPADSKAIVPSIARAKEAGIPVIITNSQVDESGIEYVDAFTGPDNYKQGVEQANMMNEALGGKGNVAVIELFKGSAPNVDRLQGFKDRLEELNSDIKIVAEQPGDGDKAKAKNVTNDLLTKYGDDLNGIVGQDDIMAVGAAEAVRDAGFEGKIKVIGNGAQKDALAAVKSGLMYGTLIQSPSEDAELAIEATDAVVRGKDFPKETFLDITHVTKDNVDEFEAEW